MDPTDDEIISALRRSGWLLEQDTYGRLIDHGFVAQMGRAYQDPDHPETSREMDVWAYRSVHQDAESRTIVRQQVIAECKANTAPYVFVGRPVEVKDRLQPPTEFRFPRRAIEVPYENADVRGYTEVPPWRHLNLHTLPGSPATEELRATQMTRLERKKEWVADNHGIFTGLVFPLAKAVRALQESHEHLRSRDDPNQWAVTDLIHPIVVTTADLYFVDATAADLVPELRRWVPVTRSLKSKSVTGEFLVDVVKFDHLDEYINERLIQFGDSMKDRVKSDPAAFRKLRG